MSIIKNTTDSETTVQKKIKINSEDKKNIKKLLDEQIELYNNLGILEYQYELNKSMITSKLMEIDSSLMDITNKLQDVYGKGSIDVEQWIYKIHKEK